MEQFIEFYKEYSGCTDIYAYCERDFQRAVSNSVDEIKKDLISMGVYDYDYDIIYKKIAELGCLDEFYSVHDDLTKQIDVIKDHIALEFVKEHEGETEEDAYKAKKQLIDYCNDIKLDVSDDLECISYIG